MNDLHNNLANRLKQHIESAPLAFDMHQAPDLSEMIWQRHQAKKRRQWLAIAAGAAMLAFTGWMQNSALTEPTFIAQNHQLEQQLAALSGVELSEQQRLTVADWHHELALIDQSIEQLGTAMTDQSVWVQRSKTLSKMVAFYSQPVDVFEL